MLFKAMRAGRTVDEMRKQLGISKPELLNGDPILKERVKIDAKDGRDYGAWLGAIHEKTGLTVLSDSYWEQTGSGLSGEVVVRDILERVGFFDKTPSKEDSALVISDNLWYEKRPAQIPDYYLDYYTKQADTSGLSLDDLKRIALELTDDQINKNLLLRKVFEEYRWSLEAPKTLGAIRLFALLTPEQVAAITLTPEMLGGAEAPRELPVEDLPPDALRYAMQILRRDVSEASGKKVTICSYEDVTWTDKRGFRLAVQLLGREGVEARALGWVMYPIPKPPSDTPKQP